MDRIEFKQWIIDRNREYRNGELTVSDDFYNKKLAEYVTLYPDDEISNLAIIESNDDILTDTDKVKLPKPMFSLEKEKTLNNLFEWLSKNKLPKDTELGFGKS